MRVDLDSRFAHTIMTRFLELNRTEQGYTVDSRYLDLAYLEQPLISKWKPGPCFNMEI